MPSTDDKGADKGPADPPPEELRSIIIDIHNSVTTLNKKLTEFERRLGLLLLLTALPLGYLLVRAPGHQRPLLYYVQIGLMLAYLVASLVLDYVLKIEFRQVRWMVIVYVMLFFTGTGGMVDVASAAGSPWMASSVVLFLIMACLAFVQRAKTGML